VGAVRKWLCPALRDLLQHGRMPPVRGSRRECFGCSESARAAGRAVAAGQCGLLLVARPAGRAGGGEGDASARLGRCGQVLRAEGGVAGESGWETSAQWTSQHGKEFSNEPLRRLSQSFQLESVGGRSVTSKQLLLATVDGVLASHSRLKRSADQMFKAFVCAALK